MGRASPRVGNRYDGDRRGSGGLFRGFEADAGMLFRLADRVYYGWAWHVQFIIQRARAGGTRGDASYDQSFAHQAGIIFVRGRDLYEHASARFKCDSRLRAKKAVFEGLLSGGRAGHQRHSAF